MKRLLFVDDELNILQGLRRMLRSQRQDWEMDFAGGGVEAQKLLSQHRYDAVISDMRMPFIDGAELLKRVREVQPHTVRIILSGQSDKALTYRTVGPSHQFLAKPCDSDHLIAVLLDIFHYQDAIGDADAAAVISQLECLPTPPSWLKIAQETLEKGQGAGATLSKMIASDPGLAASVLHLANTCYFGIGATVSCPAKATRMLDFEVLRDLAGSQAIFRPLPESVEAQAYEAIVATSYNVGMVARRLVAPLAHIERRKSRAFTAGLLHSAGRLVQLLPEGKATANADPSALGAYMACLWGFEADVVSAIARQNAVIPDMRSDIDFAVILNTAKTIVTMQNLGARLVPAFQGYFEKLRDRGVAA